MDILLSKFDSLFEEIGSKIIIVQEKVSNVIEKIILESIIELAKKIKYIIKNYRYNK